MENGAPSESGGKQATTAAPPLAPLPASTSQNLLPKPVMDSAMSASSSNTSLNASELPVPNVVRDLRRQWLEQAQAASGSTTSPAKRVAVGRLDAFEVGTGTIGSASGSATALAPSRSQTGSGLTGSGLLACASASSPVPMDIAVSPSTASSNDPANSVLSCSVCLQRLYDYAECCFPSL